ncbi:hypothetical protein OJ996_16045 [Luteolibacter sp. GHJ8]|uniref:FlgD Ig-like domain-containing protein n=1 Tax=Luteolibacter rhizosphaerae TaxID=2989719 RepID=A0ABT3G699_9BACT|nr:hypothetical protein [Luteolibacter rhizosphaerae]MCW1915099.1 hypothetical protein [Luteolibacter rhizosphaerae]
MSFRSILCLCAGLPYSVAAENLTTVSTVLSPRVAFDAEQTPAGLKIVVEADALDGEAVALKLGVAGKGHTELGGERAKQSRSGKTTRWEFEIPDEKGNSSLRLAFSLEWAGGPGGQVRLKQRFRHLNPAAAHSGLSENPRDWQVLDLEERERQAADRALEIAIDFQQPSDGKASVVIEKPDGSRVRNLISGQDLAAGKHRLVWDGLDEEGNIAAPGDYRWRAISHPGLKPVHVMDFCDGPGSNHGTFQAAASNGTSLFFAAPVAEGGHEIVELAPDGSFIRGFNPPHGHGLGRVALAADENYLYAAHDGLAWGQHVDRSKPDWKEERTISVIRIDLKSWKVAEFPDGTRHSPLRKYQVGPGSGTKRDPLEHALAGMILLDGKLHIGDSTTASIMIVDAGSGKLEREYPLPGVRALATKGSRFHAIGQGGLMKIDPATGQSKVIAKLGGDPAGLDVMEDGFLVSDGKDHIVRVLDGRGQEVKRLGTPGGIVPGAYDPKRLKNPGGLVALDGKLWVTERERWQPKRLAAFDILSGEVVKEYFGPTNYGAQGAGFDEKDASRWLGQGALWKIDFKTKQAKPVAITSGKSGRRHQFWRQEGRTFVISSGKATWIQELHEDGTLRPLACLSSAHQFSYDCDWRPPAAFTEAFQRDRPDIPYGGSQGGVIEDGKPVHGTGMLWVDQNGNGEMDAAEIEFTAKDTSAGGAGWSHDGQDLGFRVPGERNGKAVLVTLVPQGWWPGGAPRYPSLNEAVAKAPEIDLPGSSMVESISDRFGNTVMNSDPAMRLIGPDGKLKWTYPNRWSNVHGSHKAPLPKTGELQGALFYSGMVPLDDQSDVMAINGNHGRAFIMTSDGLYLDEMFPDVRMMTNPQAGGVGILGGECFGGTFGRAPDGEYYFQGGGIAYRIYRVEGLRKTKRSSGSLTVSGPQSIAAGRKQARSVAESAEPPKAVIGRGDKATTETTRWDREGKFPVTVRAACDGKLLYLQYEVADASPWVNHGTDWQALFKTGDGIDLQLGTDPAAATARSNPVPGDLRLFIAPMGEENVAVLYRHRLPGAAAGETVNFQSPWRSEKVDSVRKLEAVQIRAERGGESYRVDVAIPLAELGLSDPANLSLRGDFGVIYGDAAGTLNIFRNYWSNRATGLVNDVPGEIMLSPNLWGNIHFDAAKP